VTSTALVLSTKKDLANQNASANAIHHGFIILNTASHQTLTMTMRFVLTAVLCSVSLELILGYNVAQSGPVAKNLNQHSERRSFLIGCSSLVATVANPFVANAAYGDSVNIEFPSYIEFLIEKNKKVDPSEFLYKGADPQVLLKRLLPVEKKLAEIPQLAQEKKWSQVQGTLIGPMGSLGETVNLISNLAPTPEIKAAGKKVKADVILIGTAASKKDGAGCTSAAKQTAMDLEAFVKMAFQ
jgi:hypothetical protein